MEVMVLARLQFAITTIYHFLFVPMTLGLSVLVAIMETKYVRSGDEDYKKMAKFWGKLFLINFAMGVVTGIVQEFQFGMNWSGYSRFVGDIFGAPLAIEALFSFFLESTFIGIWVFGWDKLSKKAHAICMWLVAFASLTSALWIIIANSFMQGPVGYIMNNGRAEMTDFFAVLMNPHMHIEYPHTIFSAFTTSAFFVLGVCGYHLMRKNSESIFKKSYKLALIFGTISLVLTIITGDLSGKFLVKEQPMKMAAAEALWETTEGAPLSLVAIIDEKNKTNTFDIAIPKLLSFMSFNNFTGTVRGINDLQAEMVAKYGEGDYTPPVTLLFWAFRIMVGFGMLMLILCCAGFYFMKKNDFTSKYGKLLCKVSIWFIVVPFIVNTCGWIVTDVGRQPWIVYGLQTLSSGISKSVTASQVAWSLIGFVAVYTILACIEVGLLVKYSKAGPEATKENHEEVSMWS